MEWMNKWQVWVVAGAIALAGLWYMGGAAKAADLGGNCCADLEERISELEATVAKKGNRKVSLKVYGQVSRSITMWDDLEGSISASVNGVPLGAGLKGKLLEGGKKVGHDNSLVESFVGFAGSAKINKDVTAGYVLEIAVGEYDFLLGESTNGIALYKSYVFIKSAKLGAVTLGLASSAMDGIDELTTANVGPVSRPFSLRPVVGPSGATELFDGKEANLIRYDSPLIAGFQATASWTASDAGGAGDTNAWEVALRYAGEFGDIRVISGLGYGDNDAGYQKLEGTVSAMHVPSGIFATGNYGWSEQDISFVPPIGTVGDPEFKGYAGMVGIEQKPWAAGKTTVYLEYAKVEGDWAIWSLAPASMGIDGEVTYWGGGLVQSIDAAAMDVFLSVRSYEAEADFNATLNGVDVFNVHGELDRWLVGSVGARIKF